MPFKLLKLVWFFWLLVVFGGFFFLHPLGYEWEKLWIGNPAGAFIAYFLSGRWHCSPFKKGKGRKISRGVWQTSFKARWQGCVVLDLCYSQGTACSILSRAVLLWTFHFPRKGFWHNVVLIKGDFCSILFRFLYVFFSTQCRGRGGSKGVFGFGLLGFFRFFFSLSLL